MRLQAASALGQLVVIHQRVDPLFNELINNIKSAEDSGVKDTTLQVNAVVVEALCWMICIG